MVMGTTRQKIKKDSFYNPWIFLTVAFFPLKPWGMYRSCKALDWPTSFPTEFIKRGFYFGKIV